VRRPRTRPVEWMSTWHDWHQTTISNLRISTRTTWRSVSFSTIDDDGPFAYVPGSYDWPVARGHLVRSLMPEEDRDSPNWPELSAPYVGEA
jgi:hypothetical protein